MAGLVRFQWWRDALSAEASGQARASSHPFLAALAPALRAGAVPLEGLLGILEAHAMAFEARELPDLKRASAFADHTGGMVGAYAMRLLGGDADWCSRARVAGRALALVRLAGSLSALRRAGFSAAGSGDLPALACALAAAARADLAAASAVRPPRRLLAPMLMLRIVRHRLRRLERTGYDPERLAALSPAFALPGLLAARLAGRP